MKILLTNDDGIYAPGIRYLARALKNKGHRLAVVSPDRQRSASAHSISLHQPLRARKVELESMPEINCFRVSGTPVDCVKLGLNQLIDFTPDLIISGINDVPNLGYDVLYSGTVSAAVEGWLLGFDSLAVSLFSEKNQEPDYRPAAEYMALFLEDELFDLQRGKRYLFNINIPQKKNADRLKKKITTLNKCFYNDYYETRIDPLGDKYYLLGGELEGDYEQGSDLWALKNGYVSLTPLRIEYTDHDFINKFKNRK